MTAPRISVVIPTFNRPQVLAETLVTLTSTRQQVAAESFEVIVSDDSRDEDTRVLVTREFPHIVYVPGPRRGPAANRNCGAAHARGEWLAFIDDDCQPAEGFLRAILDAGAERGADVIEGRILARDKPDHPFRRYAENLTGDLYWTGNLAIRRGMFHRLGRFDEDFEEAGEDMEFGDRIRRSGVRAVFCPAATVVHPAHVVGWRYHFRRVFQMRWHELYLLKTGQGPAVDAPAWRALSSVIVSRTIGLIRITWRSIRRGESERRRTALFDVALSWLTCPVALPYLAYWSLRFRRRLRLGSNEQPVARRQGKSAVQIDLPR